jgi:hypothetical protein
VNRCPFIPDLLQTPTAQDILSYALDPVEGVRSNLRRKTTMAFKELGTTSLKVTSVTYGDTSAQVNLEGQSALGGTLQATMTLMAEPGAQNGSVSTRGARFKEDGTIVNFAGAGAWSTVGKHKWRIRQVACVSDGGVLLVDGELDLATRSLSGKTCEWS